MIKGMVKESSNNRDLDRKKHKQTKHAKANQHQENNCALDNQKRSVLVLALLIYALQTS